MHKLSLTSIEPVQGKHELSLAAKGPVRLECVRGCTDRDNRVRGMASKGWKTLGSSVPHGPRTREMGQCDRALPCGLSCLAGDASSQLGEYRQRKGPITTGSAIAAQWERQY